MGRVRQLMSTDPPTSVQDAAQELGVSNESYRVARDVLYLFDEPDLTAEQEGIVMSAIQSISQNRAKEARETIRELFLERFGDQTGAASGNNVLGGPMANRNRKQDECRSSIATLVATMEFAKDIKVPWFPQAERDRLCQDLDRAFESVEVLKSIIQNGGKLS